MKKIIPLILAGVTLATSGCGSWPYVYPNKNSSYGSKPHTITTKTSPRNSTSPRTDAQCNNTIYDHNIGRHYNIGTEEGRRQYNQSFQRHVEQSRARDARAYIAQQRTQQFNRDVQRYQSQHGLRR